MSHSQNTQTVESWIAETTPLFVNANVPQHIVAWAHDKLRASVSVNLQEPLQTLQEYGGLPEKFCEFPIIVLLNLSRADEFFLLDFAVNNYNMLINGEAQAEVDSALAKMLPLADYKEVKKRLDSCCAWSALPPSSCPADGFHDDYPHVNLASFCRWCPSFWL